MRPIDADALIKKICGNECGSVCDEECENAACNFYDYIMDAPTIEPEVRHGRMIEGRYPNENKCSECGQEFRDDIGFIIQDDDGLFHYPKRCPECGCYWDGGADND